MLQYRGIAFVTYIHEVNAQFAREAMACQSMANDEILNVRWATEDPNPTTKVIEKRRLEEIGSAVIATKLDPRMVDAMGALRRLEDGDDMEQDEELLEPAEEPPSKKRKMDQVEQPSNMGAMVQQPQNGIISAEALQGIRALADMRNKRLGGPPAAAKPGLKGLAAYDSDDEDED